MVGDDDLTPEEVGLRIDGFRNLVTKLGQRGRDPRLATVPEVTRRLSEQVLASMFDANTLARKAVLKPVQAELRNWLEFTGLEDEQRTAVVDWVADNQIKSKLKEARVWEDVFGGSALVLGVVDGQAPDQPVRWDSIQSIEYIEVLDRFSIRPIGPGGSAYLGFGEPEYFQLEGDEAARSVGAQSMRIHSDRVIMFPGPLTSRFSRRRREGWGVSVLETAYQRLSDVDQGFAGAALLAHQFSQLVYKIKGLAELVRAGREDVIKSRVSLVDEARGILGALLLDADSEDISMTSVNVAGLPELIDRMMMLASEALEIPITLLFGRSPAGLNATGESDLAQWYERINDQQDERLRPRLEKLFRVMFLTKDGPTGGIEPESWGFRFNPIDRPNAQEQAQTHLTQAQADSVYLDRNIVTEREIRESRFGSDEFSTHTSLLEEEAALLKELAKEREALRANLANNIGGQDEESTEETSDQEEEEEEDEAEAEADE